MFSSPVDQRSDQRHRVKALPVAAPGRTYPFKTRLRDRNPRTCEVFVPRIYGKSCKFVVGTNGSGRTGERRCSYVRLSGDFAWKVIRRLRESAQMSDHSSHLRVATPKVTRSPQCRLALASRLILRLDHLWDRVDRLRRYRCLSDRDAASLIGRPLLRRAQVWAGSVPRRSNDRWASEGCLSGKESDRLRRQRRTRLGSGNP